MSAIDVINLNFTIENDWPSDRDYLLEYDLAEAIKALSTARSSRFKLLPGLSSSNALSRLLAQLSDRELYAVEDILEAEGFSLFSRLHHDSSPYKRTDDNSNFASFFFSRNKSWSPLNPARSVKNACLNEGAAETMGQSAECLLMTCKLISSVDSELRLKLIRKIFAESKMRKTKYMCALIDHSLVDKSDIQALITENGIEEHISLLCFCLDMLKINNIPFTLDFVDEFTGKMHHKKSQLLKAIGAIYRGHSNSADVTIFILDELFFNYNLGHTWGMNQGFHPGSYFSYYENFYDKLTKSICANNLEEVAALKLSKGPAGDHKWHTTNMIMRLCEESPAATLAALSTMEEFALTGLVNEFCSEVYGSSGKASCNGMHSANFMNNPLITKNIEKIITENKDNKEEKIRLARKVLGLLLANEDADQKALQILLSTKAGIETLGIANVHGENIKKLTKRQRAVLLKSDLCM